MLVVHLMQHISGTSPLFSPHIITELQEVTFYLLLQFTYSFVAVQSNPIPGRCFSTWPGSLQPFGVSVSSTSPAQPTEKCSCVPFSSTHLHNRTKTPETTTFSLQSCGHILTYISDHLHPHSVPLQQSHMQRHDCIWFGENTAATEGFLASAGMRPMCLKNTAKLFSEMM